MRIHHTIERAEQETIPGFRELLHKTHDNMVELGELTRDRGPQGGRVRGAGYRGCRSLHCRNRRGSQELVAIRPRPGGTTDVGYVLPGRGPDQHQLHNLAEQARRANPYRAGEITGPGTLICTACGAAIHLHGTGRIPPCTQCHAVDFKRLSETTDTE